MKKLPVILVTAVVTALLTSFCWYVVTGLQQGVEWLWLESEVKAPGRMALDSIQNDLKHNQTDVAKAKLSALQEQWALFEANHKLSGQSLGHIMVIFRNIEMAMQTEK